MRAVFGVEDRERRRAHRRAAAAPARPSPAAAGCSRWRSPSAATAAQPVGALRHGSATRPTSCSTRRSPPAAPIRDGADGEDILSLLLAARDEDGDAAERLRAARRADDPARRRPRDDGDRARLDARAAGPEPRDPAAACSPSSARAARVPRRGHQGDAAPAPRGPGGRPAPAGSRSSSAAGSCCPRASRSRPRSTCCTAAPTSTPSRSHSGRSASSPIRPGPTSGSRSAAASGAAWARASRCSR